MREGRLDSINSTASRSQLPIFRRVKAGETRPAGGSGTLDSINPIASRSRHPTPRRTKAGEPRSAGGAAAHIRPRKTSGRRLALSQNQPFCRLIRIKLPRLSSSGNGLNGSPGVAVTEASDGRTAVRNKSAVLRRVAGVSDGLCNRAKRAPFSVGRTGCESWSNH